MNNAALPEGWQQKLTEITRKYDLASFQQAIAFVQTIADLSEAYSLEPLIDIRHSHVMLVLPNTPEGITLAQQIERAAHAHGASDI